jgi:hypothetical protein
MAVRGVGGVTAMSAVPDLGLASPGSAEGFTMVSAPVRDADRRAVAIALDAVELLRPESDLARLLESFGRVDVLLAAEDLPAASVEADSGDDVEDDPDDWVPDDDVFDEVRAATAALGHPDLEVHRLALQPPLGLDVEDDLVAALSELIGFDPEPGVYCLAPATPADGVLVRATRRIARTYALPLLRYRCLELSLVGTGPADAEAEPLSSPSPRRAARG